MSSNNHDKPSSQEPPEDSINGQGESTKNDTIFDSTIAARWLNMNANGEQRVEDHGADQTILNDPLLQSLRANAPNPQYKLATDDYRAENDNTQRAENKTKPPSGTRNNLGDLFAPPPALPARVRNQPALGQPINQEEPTNAPSPAESTSVLPPTVQSAPPNSKSLPPLQRASPLDQSKAAPTTRHERLISWGAGMQQSSFASAGENSSSNPNRYPLQPHHLSRGRTVALGDILQSSPYETEAETYILKAIEKHSRPRTGTLDSSLWSTADQAAHGFEDTQHPQQDDIAINDQALVEEDIVDDGKMVFENLPSPAVSFSRQSSFASQSQQQRERNPLLAAKKPTRLQKRQVSVQDQLLGLTSALQALDGHGERADGASERTEPVRKDDAASAGRGHRRVGSADQFANNAVSIMDGSDAEQPSELDAMNGNGGKGHRRWGTIDNNLSVLEEDRASQLSQESGQSIANDTRKTMEIDGYDENIVEITAQKRRYLRQRQTGVFARLRGTLRDGLALWSKYSRRQRVHAWRYLKIAFCYVIIPASAVSAILFYAGGNPPSGRGANESDYASASWWLLFMCVRQMITFLLALGTQSILIDFLGLETKVLLRIFGPVLSLLIVQSKGWPCVLLFWAVYDFILLQGDWAFAHHWGYFQESITLFSEQNPSGNIVESHWNQVVLGTAIGISVITSVKRFLIGLYQGKQLFTQYGHQLAKLMDKMLIISQVAGLAKNIERATNASDHAVAWNDDALRGLSFTDFDDADDDSASVSFLDEDQKNPLAGGVGARPGPNHLQQLLDEWEEPDVDRQSHYDEDVSISAVLRFRKTLFFIQQKDEFPFSYRFGSAASREQCVQSAQLVYERLLLHRKGSYLHFETFAILALDSKGRVDPFKARQLIKLFRPDRDGKLELIEFLKSIDSVYKKYRLLLASIANTNGIDRASENIFNFAYYILVIVVVTTVWGFDPLAIFLSLSSIVLGFAFMIGKASASYFDGVLFILVRRPYNIGDRIHISNIEQETDINGSLGYERILVFKSAVEEYLRARPREWIMMTGFRASKLSPELGYVEYVMHVMHRESWQQHIQLQDSKANFQSYCLEVSNQLGMHYSAPPLPVDIRMPTQGSDEGDHTPEIDPAARAERFRSLAMTQHKIGWIGT
ncbi:hypothetical protein MPSEU_000857900 [Mayamaea pseudoterrestris]|nr:hypothetical protein MPSEU_000857900 [Mayamaea pseudoterrestris]